jgi:TonB family protein
MRKQAEEIASTVGIVGILRSGNVAGMSSLFGSEKALGSEAMNALANVNGDMVADAYGINNAVGFVGSRRGGDGTSDDTIGMGPWGRIGRGPGGPGGPGGYHPAAAKLACKDCGKSQPTWTIGTPDLKGNYDPSLIRRVVRQHMNEVKFCYEKELTRDASLSGRVVVKFSIGGMGSVTTSFIESSTLKVPTTDRCIADAVRRWEFPKPQGGVVIVSYPFVLKSVNGE